MCCLIDGKLEKERHVFFLKNDADKLQIKSAFVDKF
jgi:hypothetical protein